jgi:hypothetical protein
VRYAVVVLVAVIVVLGSHAVTRAEPPAGPTRWEYRLCVVEPTSAFPQYESLKEMGAVLFEKMKAMGYEIVKLQDFRAFLTEAGAAGWEIALSSENEWVFKRPVR